MKTLDFLLLFLSLGLLLSCASSRETNIERGAGYTYEVGKPELYASAYGFIDQEQGPTLTLRAEIIKNSLSFTKNGDSLSAEFALDFQIQDQDNPENIIQTVRVQRSINIASKKEIQSSRATIVIERQIQVEPSEYRIVANIEDLNTDQSVMQSFEAYIPKTETDAYTLSKIQMYGKQIGDKQWQPIHTYDVKGRLDSLRFVFQVLSGNTDKRMTLNSRLLRFKSDTSHARPMHYADYSTSSIEYKGIDYDEETEIQSNQRILTDYGSVFIEYKFANQERGNYRFEVTATRGEKENEVYKGRAFGIKSRNFPAIETPREMARPLAYLMNEDKHKDLMSISDSDSLKREIDRFWLKNIGNASKARKVIELYYDRVVQANKQFSNFKEGWKTDFGMIYVLFGPPWYTDDGLKEITWFYSYNRSNPEYRYHFDQPKLKNEFFPFYHYILERYNAYYTVEYMQQELWLTGQILTRRI